MTASLSSNKKVVGIFQHSEVLDIHFYNLAFNLSQHFEVYAFTVNKVLEDEQRISLKNLEGVTIKNYHQKSHILLQPKRILAKLGLIARQPFYFNEVGFLINMLGIKFDVLIGVEKSGFALMCKIKAPNALRIYYSLELYEVAPYDTPYDFAVLRRFEVEYHNTCDLTIIQDEARAHVIAKLNELNFHQMNWIYMPVSLKGEVNKLKSTYFHERFEIGKDQQVVLNFGAVSEWRHSVEVGKAMNSLDARFKPVFHGFGQQNVMDQLSSLQNVLLSEENVNESFLNALISSAYIGISIYNNDDDNNKLTILASERNARYCQNGLPFVCLCCEESQSVYEDLKFFEMVEDIAGIPEAIEKIDKNYDEYRQNAFYAFEKFYSFDNNFNALLKELN